MPDPDEAIEIALRELGIAHRATGPGRWTIAVPCRVRGALAVGVERGDRHVRFESFLIRGADRDHEAVYRHLLRRHFASYGWRFGLDADDDVFVLAEIPADAASAERLDALLGGLSTLVDETYETIMRLGFAVPDGVQVGPPPRSRG